jgi:hypothetical protein
MRRGIFMAALIFFLTVVFAVCTQAQAEDETDFSPVVTGNAFMGDGDLDGMITDPLSGRGSKQWSERPSIRPESNNYAKFIGTKDRGLHDTDYSLSEVFGYNETRNFKLYSPQTFDPSAGRDSDWNQYSSQEISKSYFMRALKEEIHDILKIDPRYNPFLWRYLLKARLGDCVVGLDARIGSSMYVSPKITWTRKFCGMPLATELKWVPELKTTSNTKGSYVWFRLNLQF